MDTVDYRGLKNANQVKAFLYNSALIYLSAGYVTLVPLKNSHFDFVSLMYGPCYRFAFLCIIPVYNLSTPVSLQQHS
jgi:hypothetical protein